MEQRSFVKDEAVIPADFVSVIKCTEEEREVL